MRLMKAPFALFWLFSAINKQQLDFHRILEEYKTK